MYRMKKISMTGLAALAALSVFNPVPLQAQSLAVTCDFEIDLGFFGTISTPLCDNTDMTAVETVVNQNEADIATNLATNNTQQTEIDANTSGVAANLATNNAQQTEIDANTSGVAANLATNNAQQTEIDANTSGVAANLATNNAQQIEIDANTSGVAANLATNNAQQIEIDANTTNIATNAANIATNTADIATNAADIVDLQDGLADLRTDMNQGLAMANAMEVFAPDPGSNFRLNVGTGYNDGEVALGVTGSGRIGAAGSTIVYIGVAASEDTTAGKAGVSFQW